MGNSLTFGPVNSSDFDVVISGEGVFDAPKKDVEKVSIPGRNGDLIIERNRYENIIVSYPVSSNRALRRILRRSGQTSARNWDIRGWRIHSILMSFVSVCLRTDLKWILSSTTRQHDSISILTASLRGSSSPGKFRRSSQQMDPFITRLSTKLLLS